MVVEKKRITEGMIKTGGQNLKPLTPRPAEPPKPQPPPKEQSKPENPKRDNKDLDTLRDLAGELSKEVQKISVKDLKDAITWGKKET